MPDCTKKFFVRPCESFIIPEISVIERGQGAENRKNTLKFVTFEKKLEKSFEAEVSPHQHMVVLGHSLKNMRLRIFKDFSIQNKYCKL